jgi:hypothetical protein
MRALSSYDRSGCCVQSISEQLLQTNKCLPVYLEPELKKRFYKGFCKSQLWPLLHYVLPMSPYSLGRFNPELWQSYVRANMIFAERLTEVVRQHSDYVWIHDYHLMVSSSPTNLHASTSCTRSCSAKCSKTNVLNTCLLLAHTSGSNLLLHGSCY